MLVLLSAFAQAQESIERLVADDAARLLTHADALVRGEAALVVAAAGRSDLLPKLVDLSRDGDDRTRQRALLALAYLPAPSTVRRLEDQLDSVEGRCTADGSAAAFALGAMRDDQGSGALARVLSTFPYASWKRQHDTLVALLLGLDTRGEPREVTALRRLYDDDANRDPVVRALLLRLLLPVDRTIDLDFVRRTLDHGSDAEVTALLQWLAEAGTPFDASIAEPLERITKKARNEAHRTAALAALTRLRHQPALELANRALTSGGPAECAQGLRTLLAIGGARQRRDLEARVLGETDAARQAALLANFDAPPSAAMVDACARLAASRSSPFALRAAAAVVFAHGDADRAGPLLRDLFRATTDAATLPRLAAALQGQANTPAMSRLLDFAAEPWRQPQRWSALLQVQHPEATRQLLQVLAEPSTPANVLAAALTAWRRPHVPAPKAAGEALPAVLRAIFE